ncbi:hypothetical protein AB0D15_39495, partial [Streptomyces sp. NPDC048551]
MLKATLVQLEAPPPPTGQALLKSAFARRLALSGAELEAVRARLSGAERAGARTGDGQAEPVPDEVFDLLGAATPAPAALGGPAAAPLPPPPASAFTAVPMAALTAVGNALIEVRRAAAATPGADRAESELALRT